MKSMEWASRAAKVSTLLARYSASPKEEREEGEGGERGEKRGGGRRGKGRKEKGGEKRSKDLK